MVEKRMVNSNIHKEKRARCKPMSGKVERSADMWLPL